MRVDYPQKEALVRLFRLFQRFGLSSASFIRYRAHVLSKSSGFSYDIQYRNPVP